MVRAGEGYRFHVTGLTHDERGYPSMNVETQDRMVRRLQDKLKPLANGRALCETGGPGRCRSGGGLLRDHLARGAAGHPDWRARRAFAPASSASSPPGRSPSSTSAELAGRVKAFVVPELNLGQMVHEVERAAAGKAKVIPVSATRAAACTIPDAILKAIVEAAR